MFEIHKKEKKKDASSHQYIHIICALPFVFTMFLNLLALEKGTRNHSHKLLKLNQWFG